MTLVILAAGMGSRYGGLKQIDPVTDNGEFIIDFSIYDAIQSGFDKIVFVIKRENLNDFRETIGKRFESIVKVEYVFQDPGDLPDGFESPAGRVKPWGTAHAVYSARFVVKEPFAVINSDDFYGRGAYAVLRDHFDRIKNMPSDGKAHYCMVGYVLKNTLTENGNVSRGVCSVSENGMLDGITERKKIRRDGDMAVFTEDDKETRLDLDSTVSMNCWGFTPDIFDYIGKGFSKFLAGTDNMLQGEYYLPYAVQEMMEDGLCDVRVYPTKETWYGVTYREDKDYVKKGLGKLIADGVYPNKLSRHG